MYHHERFSSCCGKVETEETGGTDTCVLTICFDVQALTFHVLVFTCANSYREPIEVLKWFDVPDVWLAGKQEHQNKCPNVTCRKKKTILIHTTQNVVGLAVCLPVLQVFWWLVEGKFGRRTQALAPRLFQLTEEAAAQCNIGEDKCREAEWEMDAPGWALSMGVTAVSAALVIS